MGIEQRFNVPFIAGMALREKQIQQNYRPIIAVHKWFARRPGTLFRGLLLAEFGDDALERLFFESNDFSGLRIADPFMGGGTPLIEANRLGCDVIGFDVNPMAAWIVREEIQGLDLSRYEQAAAELVSMLRRQIGAYYRTSCPIYGDPDVPVKSFLWVKVLTCDACGFAFDLFPGYLLAEDRRHPRNVVVCHQCGALNEVAQRDAPGHCHACGATLSIVGPARRGWCLCPRCGYTNSYPGNRPLPLEHRLFAIFYHNSKRKPAHKGCFFKKPDPDDLARTDGIPEARQDPSAPHVSGHGGHHPATPFPSTHASSLVRGVTTGRCTIPWHGQGREGQPLRERLKKTLKAGLRKTPIPVSRRAFSMRLGLNRRDCSVFP